MGGREDKQIVHLYFSFKRGAAHPLIYRTESDEAVGLGALLFVLSDSANSNICTSTSVSLQSSASLRPG
jgi:hypothetical protein